MNIQRLISRVEMLALALQTHTAVQVLHPVRTREESEERKKVQAELDDLFAAATGVRDECESLLSSHPSPLEMVEQFDRLKMRLDAIEERANDIIESERRMNEMRALRHQ
mgnify:FL=1